VYVAFGEAQGQMNGILLDVHGAGAQRSDPKSGDPADYPQYMGPQGDVLYVYNYARAVRTASDTSTNDDVIEPIRLNIYPNPVTSTCTIALDKPGKNTKISIYNLRGELVSRINSSDDKYLQLDLADLSCGIYFVRVNTSNGVYTSKILKL